MSGRGDRSLRGNRQGMVGLDSFPRLRDPHGEQLPASGPFGCNGPNVTPTGKLVLGWLNNPPDTWMDYVSGVGTPNKPKLRATPAALVWDGRGFRAIERADRSFDALGARFPIASP